MKMYKKSDLTLVDGMLVTESGDIVAVDPGIIFQANELETLYQKAKFIADQPSATPMPSLDGFERKSENEIEILFKAGTPTLDAKAEEAIKLMNEIDDVQTAEKANMLLTEFTDLIRFVKSDNVIDTGEYTGAFDTPFIGSVLELTPEDIATVVAFACGMTEDNE